MIGLPKCREQPTPFSTRRSLSSQRRPGASDAPRARYAINPPAAPAAGAAAAPSSRQKSKPCRASVMLAARMPSVRRAIFAEAGTNRRGEDRKRRVASRNVSMEPGRRPPAQRTADVERPPARSKAEGCIFHAFLREPQVQAERLVAQAGRARQRTEAQARSSQQEMCYLPARMQGRERRLAMTVSRPPHAAECRGKRARSQMPHALPPPPSRKRHEQKEKVCLPQRH